MNLGSIAAAFGLHLPSRTHAVSQTPSANGGSLASALAGTTTTAATTQGASAGDRIDTLIDQQVNAGTLTSAQANEVRSFFSRVGHHHHHDGDAATDLTTASAGTATTGAGATDGAQAAAGNQPTNRLDALISFLQNLRTSLSANATYGAPASSGASSGLIINAAA